MDEMMQIIDNAIKQGYTVAWGGDVSEEGFTRKGLAYAVDTKATQELGGSDMARWLKLTAEKKRNIIDSLGCNVPEIVPTQAMRQERFDNWEGDYKGTWYMTKAFIAANTMDFLINKNAIPAEIRKKLGL